ncbi:MAG: tetratricopeptide repeat protein, partial [Candidatus Limnocylindria bacterium]
MIKQNARLSLLYGEACGIRGEWEKALEALQHARDYFSRKGDRRFEALACLKLSSVYSNYGDAERAADVAEAGVALVPPDAVSTSLRLQGNLAITRIWLSSPVDIVVRECQRVAAEAMAMGLEHFAAIGFHNAGEMLLRMGRIQDAIANLEKAALFWADSPTNPFAHNEDLTMALLVDGQTERAGVLALESIRRTAPWPRPKAFALQSWAAVLTTDGRLTEAVDVLREATANRDVLGAANSLIVSRLIECIYLNNQSRQEIRAAWESVQRGPPADPRHTAEVAASSAVADHASDGCGGECQDRLRDLEAARRHLQHVQASRLYLRTMGGVSLRRGSWQGPTIAIDKRRVRGLLA